MQSRWEGRNCQEIRDKVTPAFGTVWADTLLAQEADSPAPQFLHCPRHKAKMQIPLGAKKDPQTCVSHALLPQLVTLGPSPAVTSHQHPCCQPRIPSYAPYTCPALHGHIQPQSCLDTGSVYSTFCKVTARSMERSGNRKTRGLS